MPKPVEIEFLMKDNLTPGMDKAGQSAESLAQRAKAAAEAINAKIAEQKKVVDSVSADLVRLESQLSKMKPGTAQQDLAADVKACRKVLDEERGSLADLEYQHKQAEQAVNKLVKEEERLRDAGRESVLGQTDLTKSIAEQKQRVKEAESEVRNLERAWKKAAPGNAKSAALNELNSAKQILREEREDLDELTTAQERFKSSNQRLSMQLRTLQDAMARLRLEGKQNTDEYRRMAQEAATLSDTIGDLRTQTRILSNDDANMQGFMSGINGLSGAFTTATGAMALFASENEDLAKVQARVQSVMAITMGLQQVFNTLNKDSAFRLVTVVKMKNMLTAANARLATSLGISTVAAQALMATLTLGLSVVITGLIVAWDKYSDAQEEAAEKAKERVEIESEGRAQMIKTRFEINNTINEIKKFNGTKSEEKNKVEELNRKYGEAFGYYDSLAQWYDVLIQKSEDYINMLFLQAKAQALVNKAVEADKEVADIKAKPDDEVDGAHGGFYRFFARYGAMESNGQISVDDVDKDIDEHNKTAKRIAVEKAEAKRDAYLKEAEKLMEEQAQIGKESHIGGYTKPDTPKNSRNGNGNSNASDKNRLEAERRTEEELRNLRWKNKQEEIDQDEEGAEKKRKQIALNYEKEKAAIDDLSKKWKSENGGSLTKDQSDQIVTAYDLAEKKMEKSMKAVDDEEVSRGKEKLNALLDQYKDFDQKRRDIDETYQGDMKVLNEELARIQSEGGDTSSIESTIRERTSVYKKEIEKLQGDILQSTTFYDKLFSNTSEKGYKVLRDFYKQAKDVLDGAKMQDDGVDITITDKDKSGNFVKKTVRVTVDEFQKMKKQVDSIRQDLEKRNPFSAFKSSWSDLTKAVKKDGDVTGAIKNLNSKGKEVTSTIKGWGDSLGSVFGDRFKQSMDEIMSFCDGAMDMGTGIAQIWSGDIVGGITNTLSGLSQIVSMFSSWKEKMEEMRRQWYLAEIETARAIRAEAESYAESQSKITNIIKDVEALNWLIEKGYAKPSSVSVWEAQSEALNQYKNDLKAEQKTYDELWNKLQGSTGYYEWGNSLNGGSSEWTLRGYSAEQIQLWYNQNKLSKSARDYYEAWVASGKSVEELVSNIEECYQAMQEMVMGVSFDSFLSNAKEALKEMRSDVSALGDFTEETLASAILNAFMYKELSKMLEPLYDELSENLINGTADKDYLSNWKQRFEDTMQQANDRLGVIEETTGVELNGSSTSQSGKSGSFNAMSQDQGTKLEGLFTSGQMHWANMDDVLEDVAEQMSTCQEFLRKIEEHTGKSANSLDDIKEDIKKIIRDGLKMK